MSNLRKMTICRILYYFWWVGNSRGFGFLRSNGCKVAVLTLHPQNFHYWGMAIPCRAQ